MSSKERRSFGGGQWVGRVANGVGVFVPLGGRYANKNNTKDEIDTYKITKLMNVHLLLIFQC